MNDRIKEHPSDIIFGLDIGTRTVIGVVGYSSGDEFIVLDTETIEHESRAMIDGQIHDIIKVSETINKVKSILEYRLDFKLERVSIAAAGRVLKTKTSTVSIDLGESISITKNIMAAIETQGIDEAHQLLVKELNDKTSFFCVGHSVIKYYLNGYEIDNLEGHKATTIGAKVLATFLPQSVIDSLYTAVEKAGLTVVNVSLEPIAAINVAIPLSYRLLNLALIDIGAGTSDIAITRNGSIIAYGMIPNAGDEITEQIVHKYLVDFNTAEKIKKKSLFKSEIYFNDIIGITHKVGADEVYQTIEFSIEKLAKDISQGLIELNGNKSTNAVFCVGGGSVVKNLRDKLAQNLDLPLERIAIRSSEDLMNISFNCEPLTGPASITPLGICVTSVMQNGENFIEVILNDEKIKLLNKKNLTIVDVVAKKGYNHTNLIPRKGKELIFELNGKIIRKRGEEGQAAELLLNGKSASLNESINSDDTIIIVPAKQGIDATYSILEILKDFNTINIILNDKRYILCPLVTVDGNKVTNDYIVKNNEKVVVRHIVTINDLCENIDLNHNEITFIVNNKEVTSSYIINKDDDVKFKQNKGNQIEVLINNNKIQLSGKEQYIFVDVFDFINFDLSKSKGKIVLKLNNKIASFTDIINHNDVIEIFWD